MQWVLEHLQIIIVIGGAIAYWLNQRRREKMGESADYDEDGIPENRPVPPLQRDANQDDNAERTRRIQEEIRRKIMERRGQTVPPPIPSAEPSPLRPTPTTMTRTQPEPAAPPMLHRAEGRSAAAIAEANEELENQRRLAEQLEALKARRAEAQRQQSAIYSGEITSPTETAVAAAGFHAKLLTELRERGGARRAIVLREVLGTPVGLR